MCGLLIFFFFMNCSGYMAPEYLIHGQFNVKSDIYSFGVLILEIVSGKQISAMIYQSGVPENLLSYVSSMRKFILWEYHKI